MSFQRRFAHSMFAAFAAVLPPAVALLPSLATAAPFTAGNLVVHRVGSGAGALAATGNPVFLDEYTTAGALVQTIAMPTTTVGANRRIISVGTATSEGWLTRSANLNCLLLTGYDAAIPTAGLGASTSATVNRVVAVVDSTGAIDSSTALSDYATGSNPRSAASADCNGIWVGGGAGFVRYATKGTVGVSTQLNNTAGVADNVRQVQVRNGQLYASTAAGTARLYTIGSGLPTTAGQVATALPGIPANSQINSFFFADLSTTVAGLDTLYVADEAGGVNGGLRKYSLVAGTWVSNGVIGTGGDFYRGLTGVVSGTTVTLYATRAGGNVAASGGELVSLVDSTGYNVAIAGTPTVLATAAANTTFHGVALAPIPTPTIVVAPATLLSGTFNTAYSQTITASGGTAPYTFAVTAGSLPAGLTLSAAGALSGTPTAAGSSSFTVTATDANNFPGTQNYTLVINQLAQAITGFAPTSPVTFGAAPITLTATGGASGNPVVFATTSAATICTVSGATLTITGAGTCALTANQAGNANYSAAPQVTASVVINQASQAITGFAPASPVTFGAAPITLTATGGVSGNPVTFATTSAATICTVSGATLTITGAGTCALTANQAGNTNYSAAPQVTASVVINQATQAITGFAPASPVTFGAAPITLTATGGASGNPVTFATTSAATICTLSGATLTITGAGTCALTANQAGNANYSAAPQVTASVVINQAAQAITGFAPTSPVTFGAAPITLTATGGASGNPVVFATTSAATICTVAGNTLTITGGGTCSLTANQAGNANYSAAPQVTASVVINQASQAITGFAPTSPVTFGAAPITLTATGGASGNPVTFATTSAATICTVSGATLTITGAGTCALTANQAGNANYTAASQVTASVVINPAAQAITGFAPTSPVTFGAAPITLTATGGASGNPVTFATTSAATICTVSGATLTITGAGTCALTANQAGNANYSAAPQVTASVVINQASQTITGFAPASPVTFGAAPISLTATGGASGNPVTFATTSAATICTVSGSTLTITGVGTCVVTANQAGNGNYAAAPAVTANISVIQASQTIAFAVLPNVTFGAAPFGVSATASSGLTVGLVSTTPGVCTLTGSTVTIVAAGTCTIRASQGGDANFAPAANVDRTFTVAQAAQAIVFPPLADRPISTAPFTISATGGASGNAVTFASTTPGVCTVSGSTVTLVAVGTCTIRASQTGNGNYLAATDVDRSFAVNANPTIAIAFLPPSVIINTSSSLTITLANTNAVPATILPSSITLPAGLTATSLGTTTCGNTATLVGAVYNFDTGSIPANASCVLSIPVESANAGGYPVNAAADALITSLGNNVNTSTAMLTVTQAPQIITGFAPASPVTFGAAPVTLSATGGASGNPVVFATTSPASICTVSGATLTIAGAGTCVLTADQAGTANYTAASQVIVNVVINPAPQAIVFAALPSRVFGTPPFFIAATGGASGNPVTFSSVTAATCAVSGSTVTLLGVGTCTLRASQAGNANYSAAANVDQSFIITQGVQAISGFTPASPITFGAAPVTLTATGGASGNPVLFTTTSPATVCTIVGNQLTYTGVGSCLITASQAGNTNYAAAPALTATVVITQAAQTIAGFAPASPIAYAPGTTFTLTGTGGASGNAVVFASTTPAVCTVSGAVATVLAAGTCTVTANQAGNANYIAAPQVTATVIVTSAAQTITFPPIGSVLTGAAPFPISATASSGLPVTLASATPTVCTVSGNIVTVIAAGTCTITASQAGNANYAGAPTVSQSFSVGGGFELSSSAGSLARYGEIITLTARVVGTSPRGTVEFGLLGGPRAGQIPACRSVPVVNGIATCIVPSSYQTTQPLAFAANYSGDGTNSPASTNYLQTIALDTAVLTATIEQSPPVPVGTPFTVTALVRMRNAAGTITFYDGTTSAPVPLKGCEARPVALLADSTDAAIATCTQVSTAAAMPVIVAYTYPANHVSGRIFEQIVQRYQPLSPAPADYTDIWWRGIGENGWGLSTAQHGATQFNVLYTYDNNGKATWYAMSGGSWNANFTSYTGPLYQPSGSPFSAYDARRFQVGAPVGSMTISYTSPSTATLNYTINGVSGSKPIERQVYAAPDGRTRLKVNDLWWNGFAENGWGMNISQQGSFLFPTWYTYDETGKPNFYVISGGAWNSVAYTGDLYTATSSLWLGVPYNPAQFKPALVGRMTLDFANGSEGTMTYTVNGVEQTKRISRTEF